MGFGARLAEERKRLGLKQAEFASLVGTDVPKQSLYENDRRELRADYLARLADAKVDVVYVLTGQRSEGAWLGDGASGLVSAYLGLPANLQDALLRFAVELGAHCSQGPGRTLHGPRTDYRPGEPG
ncbi:MAG TPA: helix-turn-helix transcriptional regulator [Allosphingosinicella sp.]|nr:helix-turn-helix transcriptional regulator [Allosphingosinicella sp.]